MYAVDNTNSIDRVAFTEAIKRELQGRATAEDTTWLWKNNQTIHLWQEILQGMDTEAKELLASWEEEFHKKEQLFLARQLHMKKQEFDLFAHTYEKNASDLREQIRQVQIRLARIVDFFTEKKVQRLTSIAMQDTSEEVLSALAQLSERQDRIEQGQARLKDSVENWGWAFYHGLRTGSYNLSYLVKLGFSEDEAFSIHLRYLKEKVVPWRPFSKGPNSHPIPNFKEWLIQNNLHLGPE